MPRYRTSEYQHLILAERALAQEIENPGEESNLAALASSLVRVIDQKRVMRGQPAPRPADLGKRRRDKRAAPSVMPLAPAPAEPSAPPSAPAQDQDQDQQP